MAFILSLETSTSVCSAAIHERGNLLATSELHVGQSAASKLALLVDEIRKIIGIELSQLSAVAVSSGPGSYTGLRIGTSTAKGLCYALNIPLISVNTLDLMAYQVSKFNFNKSFLCPMIDARRMEVYCQVVDDELKIRQPIEAKVIDETSFLEYLNDGKVMFFGDGSSKCKDVVRHVNATFVENIFPSSSHLGFLAYQKFQKNNIEDLALFEPFYLKDFVAKKAKVNL